ncbi:hypothetical protein Ancab_014111, partial [Ancistrocladus abbreviatus]
NFWVESEGPVTNEAGLNGKEGASNRFVADSNGFDGANGFDGVSIIGAREVGLQQHCGVEPEGPVTIGADSNRQGCPSNRIENASNVFVGANGFDGASINGDGAVRSDIEVTNRTEASPEWMSTEQLVAIPLEQSSAQIETLSRRQVRKKSLDEILNTSPCPSKKGKRSNCRSRIEAGVFPKSAELLMLEATQSVSDSRLEVEDSQILNMNHLHCSSSPRQLVPNLTPRQIWDFIEQIGVRDKINLEDVVHRIGDMEQWDWEAFQKLASAGKPNVDRREVSSSK